MIQKKIKSELCNIDWKLVLEINKKDVDFSSRNFFKIFNNLQQKHAPIKKNSNKDKKTMKKPWITKGILKSIEKRTEFTENVLELKIQQKKRK